MTVGKIIKAILSADSGVTALVGDRISPQVDRQAKVFPRVIYGGEGEQPVETYGGTDALTSEDVTVACVGQTYKSADELAKAVKTALADKDGVFAGVTVADVGYLTKAEGEVSLEDDPDFVLFTTELSFKVWFYQPDA